MSDGLAFQGYFVISCITILYVIHVFYKMYTLHITWPGMYYHYVMDNVRSPLLSCVLQWVVMCSPQNSRTSKEEFIYGVNNCVTCSQLYQPDVSSDVSGGVKVSYHRPALPGGQYKLVCLIFGQYFG